MTFELRRGPHGIDLSAPGGIDALLAFHRAAFGNARMTVVTDALDKMRAGLAAEAVAKTIATAKADLLNLRRGLDAALAQAAAYADPDGMLTAAGLQAKRDQLAQAARQDAAPALEQLRNQVAAAAQTLATHATAGLPKEGDDPASIMRTQRAWDRARLRLDAGIPLATVLENADVETALAIREWAPSYLEAASYRAGAGDQPAPDHTRLTRAVDTRLAELTGPDAVAALTAAHEAVGVAAYIDPGAKYLGSVIAGVKGTSALGSSVESHYAEQETRAGLGLPDAPAADAPATEGGAA